MQHLLQDVLQHLWTSRLFWLARARRRAARLIDTLPLHTVLLLHWTLRLARLPETLLVLTNGGNQRGYTCFFALCACQKATKPELARAA